MPFTELRGRYLECAIELLQGDPRIAAVWLAGSLGRGDADEWSDIDLFVVVEDDAFPAVWDERRALYDQIAPQLLVQTPIPQNSQLPGGNFQLVIFEGPVEIDWTFGPLSSATRAANTRLCFERVPIPVAPPFKPDPQPDRLEFFWSMASIAVKYIARDDMFRAAGMISLLRDTLQAIDPEIAHQKLERLARPIAQAEIQRLCDEAVRLDRDRLYFGIAEAVNRLIVAAS